MVIGPALCDRFWPPVSGRERPDNRILCVFVFRGPPGAGESPRPRATGSGRAFGTWTPVLREAQRRAAALRGWRAPAASGSGTGDIGPDPGGVRPDPRRTARPRGARRGHSSPSAAARKGEGGMRAAPPPPPPVRLRPVPAG